ncbi:hypothetical protein EDF22_3694 [Rathayibacter sp. PhB127]|nr:hypothetical protein EDF22_3694 [Rathayibacter sp. PhB127]TDX81573.1 hypothetical protein EDF35_1243 [Rathayibacter sp. PhB151]
MTITRSVPEKARSAMNMHPRKNAMPIIANIV